MTAVRGRQHCTVTPPSSMEVRAGASRNNVSLPMADGYGFNPGIRISYLTVMSSPGPEKSREIFMHSRRALAGLDEVVSRRQQNISCLLRDEGRHYILDEGHVVTRPPEEIQC